MILTSRPLLATKRDQALFAGRDGEVERISRDLRRGFSVLVEGDRGSGRTTLLRKLMWIHDSKKPRDGGTRAYVRAAGITDAAMVLNRVLDVLQDDETASDRQLNAAEALRELATRSEPDRVCVLLDDVDPRLGNQLFGVLRDDLWEAGAQWVVTASTADSKILRMPPADAFFETTVRLDPLSREEAVDLLRLRMPLQRGEEKLEGGTAVVSMLAGKGGQPRELLERARQVDENNDPQSVLAAGDEIRKVLATLSRPANMLYAEIRHRDPISASDEEVQEQMGWTRPRLVQVLSELEHAGLIESYRQSRSGPGQPKKMFRVLSPFERRSLPQVEEG